ncbi:MAG: MFS transporter [Candidatus Eisenbacteria bacterium]|nr:MFS transporter [Candidatus Eisenbacteria bacterium]
MATTVQAAAAPGDPKPSIGNQIGSLPRSYWMVNIIEMFERLAYYGVRVVIPIYIAQADAIGGLHFTMAQKANIFAIWAAVQTFVPLFSGGFADRYGYKRTIAAAVAINVIGYLLMATQREYLPFLLGCCTLAFGTAIFKPGVQGTLSQSLSKVNSGVGWGIFYMMVNVGAFLGPPLAHELRGLSWPMLFMGCACIMALNYLMLLTYPEVGAGGHGEATEVKKRGVSDFVRLAVLIGIGLVLARVLFWGNHNAAVASVVDLTIFGVLLLILKGQAQPVNKQTGTPLDVLVTTFRNLMQPTLLAFILIMSGFWLMFMQLFDLLPNFIEDWVDSSQMVAALHVPQFMLQQGSLRGPQMSQEWMINFDAGLVIVGVVFVSWLVSRMRRIMSITIGMVIATAGLVLSGYTTSGYLCLLGILVFAVGEMLASPKLNEYLGVIAPPGQKGLYMGYANVPFAIGWVSASKLGGYVYGEWGEKAKLAQDYLAQHHQITGVSRPEAMQKLLAVTGLNHVDATSMLWNAYHPGRLFFVFGVVGMLSALLMLAYSQWVKGMESHNV